MDIQELTCQMLHSVMSDIVYSESMISADMLDHVATLHICVFLLAR